jgi:succinate dehydrogenase/fumarate reductase iron-sulfur protein
VRIGRHAHQRKNGLACKTLIKDVAEKEGDTIRVEPLRYLPVLRDLIVDQADFFEKYRAVKPFLINEEPVAEKERIQSQEERLRFDDTTNCILCASCYSACPILEDNPAFLGPAAISQAYRFLADTRDRGFAGAPAGTGRPGRRLALPEPFQVHPVLSAGDPDHQTHQPDQTLDQTTPPAAR